MVDAEGARPRQLRCDWNLDNFNDMLTAVNPREKNKLPKDASLCRKQFLIFDRSGDETRVIASPFLSHMQNRVTVAKRSFDAYSVGHEKLQVEKKSFMNHTDQEKVDESNLLGEESEMHEDTEEIDALLYSDDSEDDSDDEDDEVTSTGHSPLKILGFADEVASSDGTNKRQKFLHDGFRNSSLVDSTISMKLIRSSDYDNDVESSCAVHKNPSEDMDSGLTVEEKKVKIRKTLKVLEKIVPGLKTTDPLFIIDGAIDYLKSLKLKAESLEVCLTTSPKVARGKVRVLNDSW